MNGKLSHKLCILAPTVILGEYVTVEIKETTGFENPFLAIMNSVCVKYSYKIKCPIKVTFRLSHHLPS